MQQEQTHKGILEKSGQRKFHNVTLLNQPGGEICSAQVDEKIPFPVQHGEKVLHAAQVGLQQAGTTPDGDHPPGRGSYVWVLLGNLQDLPMQIARPLQNFKAKGQTGKVSDNCVPASQTFPQICSCHRAKTTAQSWLMLRGQNLI